MEKYVIGLELKVEIVFGREQKEIWKKTYNKKFQIIMIPDREFFFLDFK